jgi:hypothetical protein
MHNTIYELAISAMQSLQVSSVALTQMANFVLSSEQETHGLGIAIILRNPSTLHLLQCKGRNTHDLTTTPTTKNSSKRSVLRACDCSVSYSEANYNLGQADRAAAAPPALILNMFVVVVGP